MFHPASKRAFTLVELSIVLVILGLLVGGVLSGQSLIRASELRAVSTEYSRYLAATETFRDKYFSLPGDMSNATAYWGKDNTRCPGDTGINNTPGTCNGAGDGRIDIFGESYRYWQHLALAGLIEGSYSGFVSPLAASTGPVRGRDVPASRLGNALWQTAYLSQLVTVNFEMGFVGVPDIRTQYLIISGTNSGYWINNNILKPEEAWNIDTKLDDGKPASGTVRSGTGSSACTDVFTAAAQYALTNTSANCMLGFIIN